MTNKAIQFALILVKHQQWSYMKLVSVCEYSPDITTKSLPFQSIEMKLIFSVVSNAFIMSAQHENLYHTPSLKSFKKKNPINELLQHVDYNFTLLPNVNYYTFNFL